MRIISTAITPAGFRDEIVSHLRTLSARERQDEITTKSITFSTKANVRRVLLNALIAWLETVEFSNPPSGGHIEFRPEGFKEAAMATRDAPTD